MFLMFFLALSTDSKIADPSGVDDAFYYCNCFVQLLQVIFSDESMR